MPAMSGRLVGPAQLVSAAILRSAHPGPTSTDHAHRWSLAMSQRRLPAVHLHRATAWDGGPSCATDTACGRHLAPAAARRRRPAGRKSGRAVGLCSQTRHHPAASHTAPASARPFRSSGDRDRRMGVKKRPSLRHDRGRPRASRSDRRPARSLGCQHRGVAGRATQYRADRP